MGKHAAAEGASGDPIVAAALATRPEHPGGAHAAGGAKEGSVGWPASPVPGGGGLGWPADPDPGSPVDPESHAEPQARSESPALADATVAGSRRGWRRLFGAHRVA